MVRPTVYKEDVAERILERVAAGESIVSICNGRDMPKRTTVAQWVYRNFNDFGRRYYEAFSARCALMAQECVDIVDEARGQDMAGVTCARNRADVRKWLLSRLIPEHFGERIDHRMTLSGNVVVYVPTNGRAIEDQARVIDGAAVELLEAGESEDS